jgi:hypothetical protein
LGASPGSAQSVFPRLAILLLASIAFLAVFGYVLAGFVYLKFRLDSANSAYNTAVEDQNGLAPLINSLKGNAAPAGASTLSASQLQHDRDVMAKWVNDSQAAESQVEADEQLLTDSAAGLSQDRWLAPFSGPTLDRASDRMAAEHNVLADARAIMSDYVQVGSFFQSLFDIEIDFNSIGVSARAQDLNAVNSEIARVRTDTAKAISLDKAPGLPAEVAETMRLIQVIDGDFSNVLNAAFSHNASALSAAEKAGDADIARLQAIDHTRVVSEIYAFYSPFIEAYNKDVAKAKAI